MQMFESESAKSIFTQTETINRFSIKNPGCEAALHSSDSERIKRLIRYNNDLEEQMSLIHLNENFLESKLEELESIMSASDNIEKWSLARLTELALFCAGNYANNNCIAEVGDLMINPRLILVHIKGEQFPVKKKRHTLLTEQFKNRAADHCSVIEWLKFNTIIETVKEPILPHLLYLLGKNHCSEDYIDSVRKRINRIVELISCLSMAGIPKDLNIKDWKSFLEKNENVMIEDLFYQFDAIVFNKLGEKICLEYEIDPAVVI